MQTWIALLRGINVGGNNILPMAQLKKDLEALKLGNIRTYIQSGNIVFTSAVKVAAPLAKKIAGCIEESHGFRPHVFVLSEAQLTAAAAANPFPDAVDDPKTLHFLFLAEEALSADIKSIEAIKKSSETYKLTDEVFYLHAPEGIGRSKLAAQVEKHLGVATTGRNYRTVEKLMSLAASK